MTHTAPKDALTDELRREIDAMDYEALLRHRRFAPLGDSMCIGAVGEYIAKMFYEKRAALGAEGAIRASKSIGWGRGNQHNLIQ